MSHQVYEVLEHQDGKRQEMQPGQGFRQAFLNAAPANKDRGRTADQVEHRLYGDCAVFTCRVTTARSPDGRPGGRFWNTRLFVRENGQWRCLTW